MSRFLKSMIVLLAIAAIATPAIADDYKFSVYGSARTSTFYSDFDQADSSDFLINLQGNSRFGLKASNGAVSGHYEMAVGGGTRLMYGSWDFGAGSLIVGQNYTAFGVNNLANLVYADDDNFIGEGAAYDSRRPQIQIALDNGLSFYIVQNPSQAAGDDVNLPKLQLKYAGKTDMFNFTVSAGYNSFDNGTDDFTAFVGTFTGTVNLAPAAITFSGTYGINAAEFGLLGMEVAATADDDVTLLMGFVEAAIKANDMNTIRLGVGYAQEERDGLTQDETRMAYYVHDQITLAPGFYVVPEIAFYDGMDDSDGSDGEQSLHIGAKWQINF